MSVWLPLLSACNLRVVLGDWQGSKCKCECFAAAYLLLSRYVFSYTLFFYNNVVFPAPAEYSYFSADFRLKIFLYYSYIIAYDISVLEYYKCLVSGSGSRYIVHVIHRQRGQYVTSNNTWPFWL